MQAYAYGEGVASRLEPSQEPEPRGWRSCLQTAWGTGHITLVTQQGVWGTTGGQGALQDCGAAGTGTPPAGLPVKCTAVPALPAAPRGLPASPTPDKPQGPRARVWAQAAGRADGQGEGEPSRERGPTHWGHTPGATACPASQAERRPSWMSRT